MASTKLTKVFCDLPAEIRIKIWLSARDVPRIIPIQITSTHELRTSAAPPVVLHVNHESRTECISGFVPLIGACYPHSPHSRHPQGVIYVNFDVDTILINEEVLRDSSGSALCNAVTRRDVLDQVRYLAVNDFFEGNWNWWIDDEGPPGNLIREFKGLEELIILIGRPPPSETEEICLEFRRDIKNRLEIFLEKIAEEESVSPRSVMRLPKVKTSCFYLDPRRHMVIEKLRMVETESDEVEIAKGNLRDWKNYFMTCVGMTLSLRTHKTWR
jgi:hypothetical protein